jgi:glycosyltransferase involved in cell wall biosynthesis
MSQKRLLIVATRFPYPAVGGDRLRVFHLCRLLSRHFQVELLALGDAGDDDIASFQRETGVVRTSVFQHGSLRQLRGALRALVNGMPLQVGYYENPALAAAFAEAVQRSDLVLCHLIRAASLWDGQALLPGAIDMCDAISSRFTQLARQGRRWHPGTWVSALEGRRTRRYEAEQAGRFDLVTTVTGFDAKVLGLEPDSALTVTQGVDFAHYPFVSPQQRRGRQVAFIGKMDSAPNRMAVDWFIDHVLPQLPEPIGLKVIGDCSERLRKRWSRSPRVVVTGRVDSVSEACADCFAGVAPVAVATGIQNKALEYFALGLPAVLSPSVARGLDPASAGAFLQAREAGEWVDHVTRVWSHPAMSVRLAVDAREYVEAHHDWKAIGNGLSSRLLAMCADSTLPRVAKLIDAVAEAPTIPSLLPVTEG